MSKFLYTLVRSEGKSCSGKTKYPREDSAERSARDMEKKKGNNEIFEHYKCDFCVSFHIGHRTNFDWIPPSHANYTLLLSKYYCSPCHHFFITNTCFSNRILSHFADLNLGPETYVRCPTCKATDTPGWLSGRKWVPLTDIPDDSTESAESLWERHPVAGQEIVPVIDCVSGS